MKNGKQTGGKSSGGANRGGIAMSKNKKQRPIVTKALKEKLKSVSRPVQEKKYASVDQYLSEMEKNVGIVRKGSSSDKKNPDKKNPESSKKVVRSEKKSPDRKSVYTHRLLLMNGIL